MHYRNLFFMTLTSALITGCGIIEDDSTTTTNTTTNTASTVEDYGIVMGRSADYSTASLSVINASTPSTKTTELNATSISDTFIDAYGSHFYRVERFGANNITKYSIQDPTVALWQCSTEGSDTNSNPYQIIHVSESKAYVLRYGTGKVWIVNPSISSSADCASSFKIGEIDLSAFDSDGVPEMSSATLVNDRLYISLQRLTTFTPVQNAQVVIIDTNTETIVDTDSTTAGDQAITITSKNPGKIIYSSDLDKVLVQGVGNNFSNPVDYSGGIDSIDPTTFAVTQIIDDSASTNNIANMALVSASQAYFVSYNGANSNSLYQFNPSNGDIVKDSSLVNEPVAGIANRLINSIAKGPNNTLWLGVSSGVLILNTSTNTITESLVDTKMIPTSIVFLQE